MKVLSEISLEYSGLGTEMTGKIHVWKQKICIAEKLMEIKADELN